MALSKLYKRQQCSPGSSAVRAAVLLLVDSWRTLAELSQWRRLFRLLHTIYLTLLIKGLERSALFEPCRPSKKVVVKVRYSKWGSSISFFKKGRGLHWLTDHKVFLMHGMKNLGSPFSSYKSFAHSASRVWLVERACTYCCAILQAQPLQQNRRLCCFSGGADMMDVQPNMANSCY